MVFLFWGQQKTEFGFFGYQECFFQPLPPDLLASRRQPGLQSSFGLCHCHWKNGTWIFWDPRCGFERSMRKTSRASGVLQEIIHLISWGSSDFPWLDFRSKKNRGWNHRESDVLFQASLGHSISFHKPWSRFRSKRFRYSKHSVTVGPERSLNVRSTFIPKQGICRQCREI